MWGPVTAKATHPTTPKLLYKWSLPQVISKKVSDILYKTTYYKTSRTGDGKLIEHGPFHVNRLSPYTPLSDGSPSVSCNPERYMKTWTKPKHPPKIGDIIIIYMDPKWEVIPFAVC